jgi:hypothetical protein
MVTPSEDWIWEEKSFTFFLPCSLENVVMRLGSDPQQQQTDSDGREF